MRPPLLLWLYALAVACCGPAVLVPLTARGISARLGLAAWLTAMASTLAAAGIALALLVRATVTGWDGLAAVVCRSVSGQPCTTSGYAGAAVELTLAAATLVAGLVAAALAWRSGRSVRRTGRLARAHAETARVTGRALDGAAGAVVLDSARPAAYCVAGRPATIVLSSGALALLDPAQLAAVLAHERAHLAGRHHLLLTLSRCLATAFPAVPLFASGRDQVAALTEMCADDAAARRGGRGPLLTALLAMATGLAVPAGTLGAAAEAVTARLLRLADVPPRGRRLGYGGALAALIMALAVAPPLVAAVCARLSGAG